VCLDDLAKRKTLDVEILLDRLASNKAVTLDLDQHSATWAHYSGPKSYNVSHFLNDNSMKTSSKVDDIIQVVTAFTGTSSKPPKHTSAVAKLEMVIEDIQGAIQDTDETFILCCMRSIRDREEMKHIAIAKFIEAMFPEHPHSYPEAEFLKK